MSNKSLRNRKNRKIMNISSYAEINLDDKELITQAHIDNVLKVAVDNSAIADNFELINVSATNFKIDGVVVDNPLNKKSKKLEVLANIELIEKLDIRIIGKDRKGEVYCPLPFYERIINWFFRH